MKVDEVTTTYVTPSIEEAATLHALGCPILTSRPLRASELATYVRAGYYAREGTMGFICSMEREDFAELLQAYKDRIVKVPVAAYQDGVNICKRLLKETDRDARGRKAV